MWFPGIGQGVWNPTEQQYESSRQRETNIGIHLRMVEWGFAKIGLHFRFLLGGGGPQTRIQLFEVYSRDHLGNNTLSTLSLNPAGFSQSI